MNTSSLWRWPKKSLKLGDSRFHFKVTFQQKSSSPRNAICYGYCSISVSMHSHKTLVVFLGDPAPYYKEKFGKGPLEDAFKKILYLNWVEKSKTRSLILHRFFRAGIGRNDVQCPVIFTIQSAGWESLKKSQYVHHHALQYKTYSTITIQTILTSCYKSQVQMHPSSFPVWQIVNIFGDCNYFLMVESIFVAFLCWHRIRG